MLLLACLSDFHLCIRLSPDGPNDLVSSIRSRIVLPARDLIRETNPSCDSLISGPRCVLFDDDSSETHTIQGIIDAGVWGYDQHEIPNEVLLALSGYVQITWRGSMQRYRHASTVTALSALEDNYMSFEPEPVENEVQQFVSIKDSNGPSYQMNSFYSYISFKGKLVSIVELRIHAPSDTGVFVRAYNNGVPRWFRYVKPQTLLDVSLPSLTEDPSLVSVDYIEIVGKNAQILSLVISVAQHSEQTGNQPRLFFVDGHMNKTLTADDIEGRRLDPSAHVIDMDTAVRKNMRFTLPTDPIPSAKDELQFTYDHLLQCLNSTTILRTEYPAKTIDNFIQSVDVHMKNHPRSNFYETFTNKLMEAPPDLVAFLIRVPDEPEPMGTGTEIEESSADTENAIPMRFTTSNNRSMEMSGLFNALLVSLGSAVGPARLTDLVTMLKVNRFLRQLETHPDASVELTDQESLDEEILTDVIVSVLQLPPLEQLSYEARKSTLTDAITILMPPGSTTALEIEELVTVLLG